MPRVNIFAVEDQRIILLLTAQSYVWMRNLAAGIGLESFCINFLTLVISATSFAFKS